MARILLRNYMDKLNQVSSAMSPKKWDELSDKEKIEVVRDEIRNNRWINQRVNQLENELRILKSHQHSENGIVLIPISNQNGTGIISGGLQTPGMFDRLA